MSRFECLLLHVATWITAASGALYFAMKYLMERDDPFSALNHPWQPYVLALHVIAAPLLVFALGLITPVHVLAKLQDRRTPKGRASGLSAYVVGGVMIVSGYFIQVSSASGPRRAWVVTHVASGAAFAVLLLAHLVVSRSRARTGGRGRAGRDVRARARLDWLRRGGILSALRRRSSGPRAALQGRRS